MFAFALWDRDARELSLVRDRMGEKPLYYGWSEDGTLLFASELKAMRRYPRFDPTIEPRALALLLRFGLRAGALEHLSRCLGAFRPAASFASRPTTSQPGAAATAGARSGHTGRCGRSRGQGCAILFQGTEEEAVQALEELLARSLRGQMLADVPLGAFLSGGVDSSTVVALLQGLSAAR
ncbi:MAG: asparagine synthase-related protein [Burkholderiales bacterium]|nr:asparagine synthase-related protein [Burkholderiales bacterium]